MIHSHTGKGGFSGKAGRNPLSATPIIPDYVEGKADAHGLIYVRVAVAYREGSRFRWLQKLKQLGRNQGVRLDERGTFFWNQVDGKQSLADIEKVLRRHFNLNSKESRTAVIEFTQLLMARRLIALDVG